MSIPSRRARRWIGRNTRSGEEKLTCLEPAAFAIATGLGRFERVSRMPPAYEPLKRSPLRFLRFRTSLPFSGMALGPMFVRSLVVFFTRTICSAWEILIISYSFLYRDYDC